MSMTIVTLSILYDLSQKMDLEDSLCSHNAMHSCDNQCQNCPDITFKIDWELKTNYYVSICATRITKH